MSFKLKSCVGIVGLCAVCGCGDGGKTVNYRDLYVKDALVEVNGRTLTKAVVERDVKFRVALEAHRNRRMTVTQAQDLEKALYRSVVENFVRKQAYHSLARELRIGATAEDLEKTRARFIRSYVGNRQKWESFLKKFDKDLAGGLSEELAFEALKAKVDEVLSKKLTTPATPDEIEKTAENCRQYNRRARKIEAETYRAATNLWKSIAADKATNAFELAVAAYGTGHDHVSTDANWGPLTETALADEEAIRALLPSLKVGDMTPPVEGDNGLVILKLLRTDTFSSGLKQERQYTFEKIFFELPQFAEAASAAEIGRQLSEKRAQEAARSAVEARIKALKVRYPKGKVVFE